MHDVEWLRSLITRVPVLMVDVARAEASGDVEAVRYARAIREWLDEAGIAVAETSTASTPVRQAGRVRTERAYPRGPVPGSRTELVSRRHLSDRAG